MANCWIRFAPSCGEPDPAFRTTYVSKQSEDILGYPAKAWTENPDLWKERIHPDDRDWVFKLSSNAVREGRKHTFEYRMITADGRTLWLRNLVTVVVENGEPRELMGVSVDITDRKHSRRSATRLAAAPAAGAGARARLDRKGVARRHRPEPGNTRHNDVKAGKRMCRRSRETGRGPRIAFVGSQDCG